MGAHTALGVGAACGMALWLGAVAAAQENAVTELTGCLITEREFARAFGVTSGTVADVSAGLVLLMDRRSPAEAGRPEAFAVSGRSEEELAAHTGQRVTLRGQREGAASSADGLRPAGRPTVGGRPPAGAVGVTPDGSPAHEPGDASVVPQDASASRAPRTTAPPATLLDLPRVRVTGYSLRGERCGVPPGRVAAPGAGVAAPRAAAAPTTFDAPGATVRVLGCVVPADVNAPSRDALVLVDAIVSAAAAPGGAVPGSSPSGSGSGTVGTSGVDGGGALPDMQGFVLAGDLAGLTEYIGRRVEITGTVAPLDASASAGAADKGREPVAHPSAPERALRVTSYRTAAGACR